MDAAWLPSAHLPLHCAAELFTAWQTHGDVPGLQQGMGRAGRPFPWHIPGMDGPGYFFLLCTNPTHTLSCTAPLQAGRE